MAGRRIVFDGLWRCLCPSIDARTFTQVIDPPLSLRLRPRRTRCSSPTSSAVQCSPASARRHISTHEVNAPYISQEPVYTPDKTHAQPPSQESPKTVPSEAHLAEGQPENGRSSRLRNDSGELLLRRRLEKRDISHGAQYGLRRRVKRRAAPVTVEDLLKSEPPYELQDTPIPIIYDTLRTLRGKHDSIQKVTALVAHLVEERNQAPDLFLYEMLVDVMADTRASSTALLALFREMEDRARVEPTSTLYHSALAALAIHPSYTHRNGILNFMRHAGMELTREGEQYAVLGMLRDGQYELAFDRLDNLACGNTEVDGWVYDIFIVVFTRLGFLPEAVQLADYKLRSSVAALHPSIWPALLDACSSAGHYTETKHLWECMRRKQYLQISDGVILNVLNTASRHGDGELATAALSQLTDRGIRLQRHHYEAMIDCYATAGDLYEACQVLCIMATLGHIKPTMASTRCIYSYLVGQGQHDVPSFGESDASGPEMRDTKHNHDDKVKQPDEPEMANVVDVDVEARMQSAVRVLLTLRDRYDVPLAAFDVVIEAMVEKGLLADAMDVYRHQRELCSEPVGLKTVQMLLQDCKNPNWARVIVTENPTISLQANRAVFERVILENARTGQLDAAFKLLREILAQDEPEGWAASSPGERRSAVNSDRWWISKLTAVAVVRACLAAEDPRVDEFVEAAAKRGMPLQSVVADFKREAVDGGDRAVGERLVRLAEDELQRHSAKDSW